MHDTIAYLLIDTHRTKTLSPPFTPFTGGDNYNSPKASNHVTKNKKETIQYTYVNSS